MSKWTFVQLACSVAMLSACASDVVIKPAVNEFVSDSRTATAAVTKSYVDLVSDTNRATAMLLAANPECGFNISVLVRNTRIDGQLRSRAARSAAASVAREMGMRAPHMPSRTYCVTEFETLVLSRAYPDTVMTSTRLRILDASEFKPQLDAVAVLSDYVAALAELADAPKLEAKDKILGIVKSLRSVAGDATGIALGLGLLDDSANDTITGALADAGPIQSYANAVSALANTLEEISDQSRDVRELRAMLLDPDNKIREQILEIGKEADVWNGQHRLVRQNMVMSSARGMAEELPKMTFERRTDVFAAFLRDFSSARPSRPATSPYGAMMVGIADAHDDLQRIAREEYTEKERKAITSATLQRLGNVLKGIAGVAALFI